MRMFSLSPLLRGLLPVFLASGAVLADAPASYQPCVACHGPAGEGDPAVGAPALAGQQAAYLARQLRYFKAGMRGAHPDDSRGAPMRAMALPLGDADIDALATWLAQLPPPQVAPVGSADLQHGNDYYQAKCGACHGPRAEGNPGLNAPALAWLDAAYLRRQFENFQRGLRGTHPEDIYGRQMKMMSTTLPDDATLDDIIAFMHSRAPAR